MADVLVLGTADWDQAIATNQHYAVRELGREHDVTFVQSMGLRKVELKWRDVSRMARRVGLAARKEGVAQRRPIPPRVSVVSPRVFPKHRGLSRQMNRASLARQFKKWSASPSNVLWLYTPVDYGLANDADRVVYHCVDLLGNVPGIDRELIEDAERRLASVRGVIAAGSSPAVVAHLKSVGFKNPHFWPNVADTAVFRSQVTPAREPGAFFAGNMTATKVDFALLQNIVRGGIDLHLAGPIAEGGGDTKRQLDELVKMGAIYHGHLALPDLAKLQARYTVGLIPYLVNDYTAGVSPLKTYEYLASGLRVVSTGVPSVQAIPGSVDVVQATQFVDAVQATWTSVPEPNVVDMRLAVAEECSWSRRGAVLRNILTGVLD